MLVEDILDYDRLFTATEHRQRALHTARGPHKIDSHTTSRFAGNRRGRRALRTTHPAALSVRRLAPRARHLRYNRFTRPPRPRRRLHSEFNLSELLDGLSIRGGYDGSQIFFKFDLDVSKDDVGDLRNVLFRPLKLLSEASFLVDLNLSSGHSITENVFDDTYADISFSSGVHLGVTGKSHYFSKLHTSVSLNGIFLTIELAVGFELQGNEFTQVSAMTQAEIAQRTYIQFNDISAKFTSTARIFGDMDIADIGNISIEDGTIAFAFGLGMIEVSDKIFLNEISSVPLALKDSAEWQTAAVMDVSITTDVPVQLAEDLILKPIISITSSDFFTSQLPSISIDLNLQ